MPHHKNQIVKEKINEILIDINKTQDRNIVIIDYGNVQKWEEGLRWKIGIKELRKLIKHFTKGKQFLRRFYYGSDFGSKEKSKTLTLWSSMVLNKAKMNAFEIQTKRVKYIPDRNYEAGFIKKCNFDVEISVDLIKESKNYDKIILFSGDGDFGYLLEYLNNKYSKDCIVFGARGHIGKELYDAKDKGIVSDILYAEDFEYRLNMYRFR